MARKAFNLGKVQLTMMNVLWERGRATAREITDTLSRSHPIAHSTVQTLLRKLEAKGAVTHEVHERTFVYRPLAQRADVTQIAVQELLGRLFDGSVYGLVSHMLHHQQISAAELERLRELIREDNQP